MSDPGRDRAGSHNSPVGETNGQRERADGPAVPQRGGGAGDPRGRGRGAADSESGVRTPTAVPSAIETVSGGHFGRAPETLSETAAELLRLLVVDHPFVDGDERTALNTAVVLYELNGYALDDEDERTDDPEATRRRQRGRRDGGGRDVPAVGGGRTAAALGGPQRGGGRRAPPVSGDSRGRGGTGGRPPPGTGETRPRAQRRDRRAPGTGVTHDPGRPVFVLIIRNYRRHRLL